MPHPFRAFCGKGGRPPNPRVRNSYRQRISPPCPILSAVFAERVGDLQTLACEIHTDRELAPRAPSFVRDRGPHEQVLVRGVAEHKRWETSILTFECKTLRTRDFPMSSPSPPEKTLISLIPHEIINIANSADNFRHFSTLVSASEIVTWASGRPEAEQLRASRFLGQVDHMTELFCSENNAKSAKNAPNPIVRRLYRRLNRIRTLRKNTLFEGGINRKAHSSVTGEQAGKSVRKKREVSGHDVSGHEFRAC